jgi:hypothetical protein
MSISLFSCRSRLGVVSLVVALPMCHGLLSGCRSNDGGVKSGSVELSRANTTEPTIHGPVDAKKDPLSAETEAKIVDELMRRHFGLRVARDENRRAKAIAMRPDVSVSTVLRRLPILRHVEEVDLSGTTLSEEDLIRLVDACPGIRMINLLDCSLDSTWAPPVLARLKSLECLMTTEEDKDNRKAWYAVFGDIVVFEGETAERPDCLGQWRFLLTRDPDAPGGTRGSLPER